MSKKFLLLCLGTSSLIFGTGFILADCVDIDVPPSGKSYSFCIEKAGGSKFIMSASDAEEIYGCSITSISMNGGSNSDWIFNSCGSQKGEFTVLPSSGIRDFNLKLSYDGKKYTKRVFYDLTDGIFIERDKYGKPVSQNEDNSVEGDDNSQDDNSQDSNSQDSNSQDDNSQDDNSQDSNSQDYNSQDYNSQDNSSQDSNSQDNDNNDKTETIKKNTTLNLTTNNKSPEVKEYVNLTIETDEDYTDKLLLSVKYRSSSSSSWSSIKNTSSTYFLGYSDDWDNGYYKMKSSNYGEITLKNLVKFKKSGSYRIYVKDTDGNEEYIQFTVSEPEDDNNEEESKITNEKTENIVSENKSNYADAASYHVAITDLLDKCYLSTDDFYYELDNGTVSSVENAVNTALKTCKDVKTEIENIGSRNGDTSLRDVILSLVKETILYFEKYIEAFPIIKNERDLTDEEKNTLYLITLELENIGDKLDELTDSANKIIETFAKKWGYELGKGCSIDGSKYGYEQTLAYRRACQLGITTIQDINSAGLDQPLTRAQLAKMMSVFEFSVLGNFPQTKGKANYKDVSSKLGDLENYIQIAYEYGIMGVDANGFAIQYFNPYGTLNRGDFAAVFSRVLRGNKYNINGANYYSNHINALKNAGFLTNTNHNLIEMRGYVILMMYRAAKNLGEGIITNQNTKTIEEIIAEIMAEDSNNTSSSSSSDFNKNLEHEYAAIEARGRASGASIGAIRAQKNEAYNRAVAGIDTSNCGSYNPYGGQSYGARVNNCINKNSNSKSTTNSKNNSYDAVYDALSNYIKASNGIDTNEYKGFSAQKKDQYDYLYDLVGAINSSTNSYTSRLNLGQNKDYIVDRAVSAINNVKGGYTPHVNFSVK